MTSQSPFGQFPFACHAVIVAAGRGTPLRWRPAQAVSSISAVQQVLRRTVRAFLAHPLDRLGHRGDRTRMTAALYDEAVAGLKLRPSVGAAPRRQESVRNLLESLEAGPDDIVLIHDAARPLVSRGYYRSRRLGGAGQAGDGAIVALPVDRYAEARRGRGNDGPRRSTAQRAVARPDAAGVPASPRFWRRIARGSLGARTALTDDAAVAERAGLAVELVMGDER
jgi:2-C-methyl-D-erythritol 4-phosphate cytidylyltransferase/2-C-methyl-D-erythritol 2,4-cyclodiphosphate synthase